MSKDPQDPQDVQATRARQGERRRSSSTSPPGGKTHEATKPPGRGEVDPQAVERGWTALDQAAGGH